MSTAKQAPAPGVSSAALGKQEVFESDPDTLPGVPKKAEPVRQPGGAEDVKRTEDVVRSELRPQLAFEQFAGKVYDLSNADFSDAVTAAKLQRISAQSSELVSFAARDRPFESPMERYSRLKSELQQFEEDMKELAKSGKPDQAPTAVANMLVREITGMEKELQTFSQKAEYATLLAQAAPDKQWAEQKRLMDKLSSELTQASTAAKTTDNSGPGRATFELYFSPQKELSRQQLNVAELDQRLAVIEKLVGNATAAEQGAAQPDLHTMATSLRRKFELLDSNKLDQIYRRAKTLMGELDLFAAQKDKAITATGANPQNQEKVSQIYDMLTKWDDTASAVPAVVSRLQSLRELHEQCAAALIRFTGVESDVSKLHTLLSADKDALAKAETQLVQNMKVIEGNMKALQDRFDALAKKM